MANSLWSNSVLRDEAVFAAYGWPSDTSNDDLLARLLALNLERAARLGTVSPAPAAEDEAGEA